MLPWLEEGACSAAFRSQDLRNELRWDGYEVGGQLPRKAAMN